MIYRERPYPLFSACGLNCGLCPRYYTNGTARCPGCAGAGFSEKHPPCGVLSCCQRHELEYCLQCMEYPCKKYEGAELTDSFISHKNQLTDIEKAKALGLDAYKAELNEKVGILEQLLESFDDGRRKGFFCIAVNLLELCDVKAAMEQITAGADPAAPIKERAALAVRIIEAAAEKENIVLKLRKKQEA